MTEVNTTSSGISESRWQTELLIAAVHVAAWFGELGFFALSLLLLLPSPGPMSEGIVMEFSRVWQGTSAFAISCAIAYLRKQASILSGMLRSIMFLIFAYALHAVVTVYGGATP